MISRSSGSCRAVLAVLAASVVFLVPVAAQQTRSQKPSRALTKEDLANAKPGRDPNQPIDEEYTKKIKEYTTETFFLSPLVDYLPASKTRADADGGARRHRRRAGQAAVLEGGATTTCGCSRRRRRA